MITVCCEEWNQFREAFKKEEDQVASSGYDHYVCTIGINGGYGQPEQLEIQAFKVSIPPLKFIFCTYCGNKLFEKEG